MNDLIKQNENTKTGLTVADLSSLPTTPIPTDENGNFMPRNRDEFELVRELLQSEKEIESLAMPKFKSNRLAADATVFALLDAWVISIPDKRNARVGEVPPMKQVVCFQIELADGEQGIVMKDGNTVNLSYADFFGKWKAAGMPRRKDNMCFVEATWLPKHSDNHPVILQAAPKQVKTVNAKKVN